MSNLPLASPAGILTVLSGVCAFFFYLEKATRWKLFHFLPPLMFIYATPVLLSNLALGHTDDGSAITLIPKSSPVYDTIGQLVLPMMLTLLLLKVDVGAAVRVMGRGVIVMLMGTLGVVLGAPVGYWLVKGWLGPEGWKAFGTLAGSWIGGTGNMAAVSEMIDTQGTEFGLAVLGDTTIYVIWLPIMLGSRSLAGWFARFTGVSEDRLKQMDEAAAAIQTKPVAPVFQDYLYLIFLALAVTWVAATIAAILPELEPFVSTGTWRILLVTTMGISLSFSPLKRIPGSHALAMALVYLFVARMGATADLTGVAGQALPFVCGALVWILIHGAFCLLAAWLLSVDVHTAAIASAANIGGAASAPIVAAYHKESLVPASILMALVGYAVGNYAAYLAAILCRLVA